MAKTESTATALVIADGTAVQQIATLAAKAAGPHLIHVETTGLASGLPDTVPMLYDPDRGVLIGVRGHLDAYRLVPERRTGTAAIASLQSFIDLVNRHKDEHSVIFGQPRWPSPKLTAVLDYHQSDGSPRNGEHRITYDFPLTEEFQAWVKHNAKAMEQVEFAAFLEEHAAELASPTEAEMIEFEPLMKERFGPPNEIIRLSRELEVHVGAKVKRQERLQSGERTIQFQEEHSSAGGEKVDVPGLFMVQVPAFLDGQPVRIPARLRYRIKAGDIVWFYQLYRWEFWLRVQCQSDLFKAAKETELPSFEGEPEK